SRCKCCRNVGEVYVLDKLQIIMRINSVQLERKLACHLRHAAFSLSKKSAAFKLGPLEIRHRLSGDQEGAIGLRNLGKVDDWIITSLLLHIDRRFRSNQSDINPVGQ